MTTDRTRLLKILRVLSWPYRYPPLSWMESAISWLAATNLRLATTVALSAIAVVLAVVFDG